MISRLPWARYANCLVRFGLKNSFNAFVSWFKVVDWHRKVKLSTSMVIDDISNEGIQFVPSPKCSVHEGIGFPSWGIPV